MIVLKCVIKSLTLLKKCRRTLQPLDLESWYLCFKKCKKFHTRIHEMNIKCVAQKFGFYAMAKKSRVANVHEKRKCWKDDLWWYLIRQCGVRKKHASALVRTKCGSVSAISGASIEVEYLKSDGILQNKCYFYYHAP